MRKYDIDGKRKCRNWQTSKTKDLVGVFSCGFKSHLPHHEKERLKREIVWVFSFSEAGASLEPMYGHSGLGRIKQRDHR